MNDSVDVSQKIKHNSITESTDENDYCLNINQATSKKIDAENENDKDNDNKKNLTNLSISTVSTSTPVSGTTGAFPVCFEESLRENDYDEVGDNNIGSNNYDSTCSTSIIKNVTVDNQSVGGKKKKKGRWTI